jgi:hypothetical protein
MKKYFRYLSWVLTHFCEAGNDPYLFAKKRFLRDYLRYGRAIVHIAYIQKEKEIW